MQPILAAIDFSDVTPVVLEESLQIAKALRVELHLFHVAAQHQEMVGYFSEAGFIGPMPTAVELEQSIKVGEERLAKKATRVKGEGVAVRQSVVRGVPLDEILKAAKDQNARMIVMGSHGHGALFHLLLGGVSQGVLKSAPCPVLLVRSQPDEVRHGAAEAQALPEGPTPSTP